MYSYTRLHELYYITLHYNTLHYKYNCNYNCNYSYHCITLHYTTLIILHYNYNCTTLHYTTLDYTIQYYNTQHYSTQHYTTVRYTTFTPHHNYNCKLQLITQHYNYNSTTPHYNYNSTTLQLQLPLHYTPLHPAVVVRWPLQPLQPLQKTQLQPPVGLSVDSLCHPWFATTDLSYRFPIFETSASYYWYIHTYIHPVPSHPITSHYITLHYITSHRYDIL